MENEIVGIPEIKRRRLQELPVHCHPGTTVGQYVPFYFCPRSIMLFILHRGNHPDLNYQKGQRPVVHLQADLYETVQLADKLHVRWAFTSSNAGARYASFSATLDKLTEINWMAVAATDFRAPLLKEGKQAEFLVFESFPWSLVEQIGVCDGAIQEQVKAVLVDTEHRPPVNIEPGWYF